MKMDSRVNRKVSWIISSLLRKNSIQSMIIIN